MNLDLKFYMSIFMRRLPYFLFVVVIVSALGVSIALILPAKYRTEALLLVESEQIPDSLASSTVRTGAVEELQIIEQRLMARATLLEIANRVAIYKDTPDLDATAIVDDMRARTVIISSAARDEATTVTVFFEGKTAEQALQVTNELVTWILRENVEMRTGIATQTLEFFKQETTRLGTDLDRQEAELLAFRTANQDSLPDSIAYRRARQTALQERVLQLQREAGALFERRVRLAGLYERTGRTETITEVLTIEQRQLQALQTELSTALLTYSPQSPQVRLLQGRVGALTKIVAGQPTEKTAEEEVKPDPSLFMLQQDEIDGQLAYIAEEQTRLEQEIEELRVSISATPANAAHLSELERDNAITRGQYGAAVGHLAEAQTGERIEVLSKGKRITVIEQAVLPQGPASPNRKLIAAGSLFGGMMLGLGLVALLELLNRSIRRPVEIVSRLGLTPIATLPYIRTLREVRIRRNILVAVILGAGFGISGGLYALHTFYMPMDMLVDRIIERTGLAPLFGQIN